MTRKAIGWYELDATDAEKVNALYDAISVAVDELVRRGETREDIEQAADAAIDCAEETYLI